MWARLVRWLAREHIAYLEYENRELRYESERWMHRCEGLMDAIRIFERRSSYMEKAISDWNAVQPMQPIIVRREEHPNAESAGVAEGKWKD